MITRFAEQVRTIVQPLLPLAGFRTREVRPLKSQLLKWVGNKQRFAPEIASYFPPRFRTYYEPFLGSGAVLATLAPERAVGSDVFAPPAAIGKTLKANPDELRSWYRQRRDYVKQLGKEATYEQVRASYNANPNGADLLYLCRSCYGGVVRFRKADGYMSTPCGVHRPISPVSFSKRVEEWRRRCRFTEFVHSDYADIMEQ